MKEQRHREPSGQARAGELTMYKTGEALRAPGFGGWSYRQGELREQMQCEEVGGAKAQVGQGHMCNRNKGSHLRNGLSADHEIGAS